MRDALTNIALLTIALTLGGCASLPAPSPPPPDGLRVISYNVALGALLSTPSPRFSRLTRSEPSIRAALIDRPELRDFDILGLQEICGPEVSAQLEALKTLGPYAIFFARADLDRPGECRKGQAILSRYPILDQGVIRLPPARRVGRAAAWIEISLPDGPTRVRVYNVHLDNSANPPLEPQEARLLQIQPVLAHMLAWRQSQPSSAVIVLGDLNTLEERDTTERDREPTLLTMSALLTPSTDRFVSTHALSYQTDWIFFDGLRLRRSGAVRLLLSDHYPLVADFDLPKPRAAASRTALTDPLR